MTQIPKVSFVVPCYRLAHFLVECVTSILSQSYKNIEIIILDDQSPDDTAEIANGIISSHPEQMISYVLNSENLGNIRNYNKGINISRGKYVWILSPDDRLRNQCAVEKYVALMESDATIGYVFSAAATIEDGRDIGLLQRSLYRVEDQILEDQHFVKDILSNNFELVAASVMIRKECYENVTLFPPDMPHRGDSYVWSLIAMKYRVGFFAEAMVDYRVHPDSIASLLMQDNIARAIEDDIAVPWRVKGEAEKENLIEIVDHCWATIIQCYKNAVLGVSCRGFSCSLSLTDIEASIQKWESSSNMRGKIRIDLAERLYWNGVAEFCRGNFRNARRVLRCSFELNHNLYYYVPVRQLMNTPKLTGRVISLLGEATAKLFGRVG